MPTVVVILNFHVFPTRRSSDLKKDLYRVALTNPEDEKGSQVILKNEDGVFVLTPALDKSFKFQTDWPENSSQPYLRSEEHTSELQSRGHLVCRLLLEKKKINER